MNSFHWGNNNIEGELSLDPATPRLRIHPLAIPAVCSTREYENNAFVSWALIDPYKGSPRHIKWKNKVQDSMQCPRVYAQNIS